MARPSVPDVDNKRTVPFRTTKPGYRALMMFMKLKDITIQEIIREAVEVRLDQLHAEMSKKIDMHIPTPYELGTWSDDRFNAWLGLHRPARGGRPGGAAQARVQRSSASRSLTLSEPSPCKTPSCGSRSSSAC